MRVYQVQPATPSVNAGYLVLCRIRLFVTILKTPAMARLGTEFMVMLLRHE